MRPLTRRSLTAATWSVLASTFTCSFGDDEEEDDKKPDGKPTERARRERHTTEARAPRSQARSFAADGAKARPATRG